MQFLTGAKPLSWEMPEFWSPHKPLTAVLPCPVRLATHRLIMSRPSPYHLLHYFN